jgi:hypothetical protein
MYHVDDMYVLFTYVCMYVCILQTTKVDSMKQFLISSHPQLIAHSRRYNTYCTAYIAYFIGFQGRRQAVFRIHAFSKTLKTKNTKKQ